MTLFVTHERWDDSQEWWVITEAGTGAERVISRHRTRETAVSEARRLRDPGQNIAVKGPRMSEYSTV